MTMVTGKQSILAPAKINLCLHVQGRFDNGYHDLAMLMQRVSLFDELEIELAGDGKLSFACQDVPLAENEVNLALRAARLLFEHVGSDLGATITLKKNIPIAAGLGGGSSDAATVLLGLNLLAGFGLTRRELMALGGKLGADVPFFILEQSAWATGIGDVLDPVPDLPTLNYVLVNPGLPVSTAWVYQNLRLTSPVDVAKLREFPRTAKGLVRLLHNDLERVSIARYPLIDEIKQALIGCGALGALMSGSGATVFGLFAEMSQAEKVAADLTHEFGWWTAAVTPLP
jgi:4-diphosphocytidyl-2-C-methyl-D-erythritol kinase